MPTYNSPGVYVEEVPPMSRPIAGVSTSTPGFVGVIGDEITLPYTEGATLKWLKHKSGATAGTPYRISSWANYVQLFGDFVGAESPAKVAAEAALKVADAEAAAALKAAKDASAEQKAAADKKSAAATQKAKDAAAVVAGMTSTSGSISDGQRHLAHAVFGFFNNGGTNCYVVRITDKAKIGEALAALSAIEDISMVAAPGLVTGNDDTNTSLISHATTQQRFAILDFAKDTAVTALKMETASPYAAAYYPWLEVFDPADYLINKGSGMVMVPPSGHIAGVYARSDAARGVFKAPANEALLGVNALKTNVSRDEQGPLNIAGINVIRPLNGAFRVWGARTAGGDKNGEYRYVSTRRYFNYLRQSIDSGTQFVVFEPHTSALWQRVIRTLTDFLTNEWRSGALFGETAKQAFFIKCDAEINPPEMRDQGRLIVEIGVAIVKPAEFVIFRIQQTSGS